MKPPASPALTLELQPLIPHAEPPQQSETVGFRGNGQGDSSQTIADIEQNKLQLKSMANRKTQSLSVLDQDEVQFILSITRQKKKKKKKSTHGQSFDRHGHYANVPIDKNAPGEHADKPGREASETNHTMTLLQSGVFPNKDERICSPPGLNDGKMSPQTNKSRATASAERKSLTALPATHLALNNSSLPAAVQPSKLTTAAAKKGGKGAQKAVVQKSEAVGGAASSSSITTSAATTRNSTTRKRKRNQTDLSTMTQPTVEMKETNNVGFHEPFVVLPMPVQIHSVDQQPHLQQNGPCPRERGSNTSLLAGVNRAYNSQSKLGFPLDYLAFGSQSIPEPVRSPPTQPISTANPAANSNNTPLISPWSDGDLRRRPSLYAIPQWPLNFPGMANSTELTSETLTCGLSGRLCMSANGNPNGHQPLQSAATWSGSLPQFCGVATGSIFPQLPSSKMCPAQELASPVAGVDISRLAFSQTSHPRNMLVDIAQTCQDNFPFTLIAERHNQPVQKVFDAFSAVVQLPLLWSAVDRQTGKLGSTRISDFRNARKNVREQHKSEQKSCKKTAK